MCLFFYCIIFAKKKKRKTGINIDKVTNLKLKHLPLLKGQCSIFLFHQVKKRHMKQKLTFKLFIFIYWPSILKCKRGKLVKIFALFYSKTKQETITHVSFLFLFLSLDVIIVCRLFIFTLN